MDRSFLSNKKVIEASRKFVCVLLSTYESKDEARLLTSIFTGRSGLLENTTFALLGPDGKEKLSRAGRSPVQVFYDADEMVQSMNRLAKRYPAKTKTKKKGFPALASTRLALNVAACNKLPLVVVYGSNKQELDKIIKKLNPVLWGPMIGRAMYAKSTDKKDLKILPKETAVKPGIFIVQPDSYGQKGTLLGHIPANTSAQSLVKELQKALAKHKKTDSETRDHVRQGRRKGVHWKTKIPVTDPGPPGRRRRP